MPHGPRYAALESEIRAAVTTGLYHRADRLLADYTQQLATELRALQRDLVAQEVLHTSQFLLWILRVASAARAHDAALLSGLLARSRYRACEEGQTHSWRLDA